jgi:hypothetical protein
MSAKRFWPNRSAAAPPKTPAAAPMAYITVWMKPDSTSDSPRSARSAGRAGGTFVMVAPAARPPANTIQTARQSLVKPRLRGA